MENPENIALMTKVADLSKRLEEIRKVTGSKGKQVPFTHAALTILALEELGIEKLPHDLKSQYGVSDITLNSSKKEKKLKEGTLNDEQISSLAKGNDISETLD